MHIVITSKSSGLNAYIYEGISRTQAVKSLVENNSQIEVGQEFSVMANSGLLLVAYPPDEEEQEFGFEYWVEAMLKPTKIVKNNIIYS